MFAGVWFAVLEFWKCQPFTARVCTEPSRPGAHLHVPVSDALHGALLTICRVVNGHTLSYLLARICRMNECMNE